MWVETISALSAEAEFAAPTDSETIADVERRLGQPLRPDLRELLMESNGVRDENGMDPIWTVERILHDNREFRDEPGFAERYGSFDGLLFFGDNGGGDQFAYAADGSTPGIFVWEHEDDTRRVVAKDLADYLRHRLTAEGDEWYVDYGPN